MLSPTRGPEETLRATRSWCAASLANALWAILLLPVALFVMQRSVIEREERYLERTFGEEYLSYKANVRRWV